MSEIYNDSYTRSDGISSHCIQKARPGRSHKLPPCQPESDSLKLKNKLKKRFFQYKIMLFTTADDLKLFSVFNKHFADRFLYTNLPWLVHRISSELS